MNSEMANNPSVDVVAVESARSPERSLVEEVYHAILLRIIRGEFPDGHELKSTHIARELGVSRTPVVQALSRLAADGIVVQQRNQRAIVRPGAENWLMEVHELRILLEPQAASNAARSMPDDVFHELRELSQRAAPRDDDAWFEDARAYDYALHLAIAENCGNLPLGETIRKCWGFKRISYVAGADSREALEQGYRDHLAILAALSARDGEAAYAAVLFHLRSASLVRPAGRII